MADGAPMRISATTLSGPVVTLEPLRQRHLAGLGEAARGTDIWQYMAANLADTDSLEPWFTEARRLEKAAQQLPFAIRMTQGGALIGSTRYLNIAAEHRRLEIGWTWLAPSHWGGRANAAAKLLLFEHAFDTLGAQRVELRTDALNQRAHHAILKLGAVEEGLLRRHMVMPGGRVRDTVQFAVIDKTWPAVRAALEARIGET
jgi:RimJ/RimL family protein N-acetyltransferase